MTGSAVLLPGVAQAATAVTVNSTVDVATNYGACGNGATAPQNPASVSLREAVCIANNTGGAFTININAGRYVLTNGELQPGTVSGANVSLVGAGAASTIIDGNNSSRVLDLDANLQGGITNSISGLTITGGKDDTFGGAGIIGGSNLNSASDSLTLTNVVVTGNHANVASPNTTNRPGGGIQFEGGKLTITNSTISNNSAGSSHGSGVYYVANGVASPEGLSITNTTFSGNSDVNSSGDNAAINGGALALAGTPSSTYNISNSRFTNNAVTANPGSGSPVGAAIYEQSGNLTVTGSTFTGNSVSGGTATPAGGAIDLEGDAAATLHYDRFTGNSAPTGSAIASTSSLRINGTENWWGCNTGPNTTGCDTTSGSGGLTAAPRLVLTATASPAHVLSATGTSTLSASLLTDSAGGAVGASNLAGAFDGLPVSFADPPGDATVTTAAGAHSVNLASGLASIDYHANGVLGPDSDTVTLDNGPVTDVLEVDQPPAITSANSANFNLGTGGSFTVTTTGYPNAAISQTGTLATGLSFHDNGNGTATIGGTPTAGSGGTYPVQLTANNGYAPNATQTLTISVGQPPSITSPGTATFTIGSPGSFTVTTSGVPTASTITESGSLPPGVTFTNNGNGTATIAGTPTGTGNTYPVTLTATNGVSPNATQALTIQVNQAPSITTNPADQTVHSGTSVSFTAAATGVPIPTVQWQKSTDAGTTFADIAGATSASYTFTAALGDDGNQYRAVFTNVAGTATTTAATLNVGTAPAFTSTDHTTFLVGQSGSFSVTTTGVPSATLGHTGTGFPGWLTLTDNGGGTGSLTGIPPAGAGGLYTFALDATNGFSPSESQNFTLQVDDSPVISSADHTTFTVGSANTFAVTTTAGYPTSTTLSATGLPSGVTFHDNNDGTATLAGDPAAGAGGTHTVTITASNGGLAAPATQSFTLTVDEAPTFTSADHTTFSAGANGSFSVTTSPAFPAGTTVNKSGGTLPAGVTFTPSGTGATISGTPSAGSGGVYTITLTVSNGIAPDATQLFTLTVTEVPVITSADHTAFVAGTSALFTVQTLPGYPPAATTLIETGALPSGVTFTDNGSGTATLAGTPAAGTGGAYPITLTATNSAGHTDQAFTLTVNESPAITSADHTTFAVGSLGNFTVTTVSGTPKATTLTKSGALPAGVTFTDNGNGTATLAGTPAAGTGGNYPITISAGNGASPNATQAFILTVTELPAVASADHTTFTVGGVNTFPVTTTAGYPPATTLTETGALPSGVTFTDNGTGTATLAGTPAAGTGGAYPITLTATNSAGHTDQAFTLTVVKHDQTITVTSGDPGTGTVSGSYTPTATSDSHLPVSYSIDAATTNHACSLTTASVVSFDHVGSCVVDFDQAGNGTYAAAPQVHVTIAIRAVATTISVQPSVAAPVYGQPVTVTAAVGSGSGTPAGTVQFSVDGTDVGAPVTVTGVRAASPDLGVLAPGAHTIGAAFAPADTSVYTGSTGTATLAVAQAVTTTAVTVTRHGITAVVAPVAPGSGTPTGTVRFSVGHRSVGTVNLVGGIARLRDTLPPGATRHVTAVYSGDADFAGSSASTARHDPSITATVSSRLAKSRSGWYRTPVTIRFTCQTAGAALVRPCPQPVTLQRNGAGLSVTRTIVATDGGAATATMNGINIDQIRPGVRIAGVRDGKVYVGAAPQPQCVGHDGLSGVARCTLSQRSAGRLTRVVATATDRAGNTQRTTVSYRVLGIYLSGAPFRDGRFVVRPGHTYTINVTSVRRPRYLDAAVDPRRPTIADQWFHRAGIHQWALGVTMDESMRSHPLWNLGVKIGGQLHLLPVRVR